MLLDTLITKLCRLVAVAVAALALATLLSFTGGVLLFSYLVERRSLGRRRSAKRELMRLSA